MQFFIICTVLFAVLIGSSSAFFNFFPQPTSGCTVLAVVPMRVDAPHPSSIYYKAHRFPSLNEKLSENQSRFNRNLHQVWVDAPDPTYCGNTGGRCCLNAFIPSQYEWRIFATGDKKKIANEQLYNNRDIHSWTYKVWTDAPSRFCNIY
ncbi:uncharacterized protein LOC116345122 [Contarinia nasturtii]|uniref:uncharacterized protein LOC116345122 n=1 Tax=Contarinia nasturtii TaxID=265458 RepID=UPI0012D4C11C|nr:uncharacterized protein LOC116345122 [Contarinia nasturtii]